MGSEAEKKAGVGKFRYVAAIASALFLRAFEDTSLGELIAQTIQLITVFACSF